jgi:hypothetical protein
VARGGGTRLAVPSADRHWLILNEADLPKDEEGRGPALPELAEGDFKTRAELAAALRHADATSVKPILNALGRSARRSAKAGTTIATCAAISSSSSISSTKRSMRRSRPASAPRSSCSSTRARSSTACASRARHRRVRELRGITSNRDYRRCVEWLGAPWGHAVAPSTPVQDYRLHVKAWQHHFAADPRWRSYRQVAARGWQVRRGERWWPARLSG